MWNQILVVTSHAQLASYLEGKLVEHNYKVNVVEDSFSGLSYLQERPLSLVFVAWKVSGSTIINFCQQLRRVQSSIPLIALIQSDSAKDRVACLEAGANDCLSSPFYLDELLARVRVQLRAAKADSSPQLCYADIVLDLEAHQAYRGDSLIELTSKEFNLLEYFMRHPQRVLTRSQILDNVWGYDFVGMSNVIEVYIRNLRKKLEVNQDKRLIQTIRYVGYILRA